MTQRMNRQYRVGTVSPYVACIDCMPDQQWRKAMEEAGKLKPLGWVRKPCDFCGD